MIFHHVPTSNKTPTCRTQTGGNPDQIAEFTSLWGWQLESNRSQAEAITHFAAQCPWLHRSEWALQMTMTCSSLHVERYVSHDIETQNGRRLHFRRDVIVAKNRKPLQIMHFYQIFQLLFSSKAGLLTTMTNPGRGPNMTCTGDISQCAD